MKIVFLSNSSFIEPNLSLVKRLKDKCELYFFVEVRIDGVNKLEITNLNADITKGELIKELFKYDKYLSLDKTYIIKTCSNKKILKGLRISFKVSQFIKKINPDLIIIDSHNIPVFLTELIYGYKSVLIIHDPFLHSGYDKFSIKLFRRIGFNLVKKKILLNEAQKNKFIEINKCKQSDVYTSFLSEYEFMRDYLINKDENKEKNTMKILFFGIISEYKGVKYLLDAVKDILDEKTADIELIIAGKGDFSFDISQYESYGSIWIINRFVTNEELAQLLYETSVVVCPYIDATQSGVVMTAYSLYKPVIATSVGGLIEMIEDGATGLIIPPGNKEELKGAILNIYNDRDLLSRMSENIKNKYENKYSWDNSAERFFSIFQDCITIK